MADVTWALGTGSTQLRRAAVESALEVRGPGSRSTLLARMVEALGDPDPLVVVGAAWFLAERKVSSAGGPRRARRQADDPTAGHRGAGRLRRPPGRRGPARGGRRPGLAGPSGGRGAAGRRRLKHSRTCCEPEIWAQSSSSTPHGRTRGRTPDQRLASLSGSPSAPHPRGLPGGYAAALHAPFDRSHRATSNNDRHVSRQAGHGRTGRSLTPGCEQG